MMHISAKHDPTKSIRKNLVSNMLLERKDLFAHLSIHLEGQCSFLLPFQQIQSISGLKEFSLKEESY
jgi:hypothetical protein